MISYESINPKLSGYSSFPLFPIEITQHLARWNARHIVLRLLNRRQKWSKIPGSIFAASWKRWWRNRLKIATCVRGNSIQAENYRSERERERRKDEQEKHEINYDPFTTMRTPKGSSRLISLIRKRWRFSFVELNGNENRMDSCFCEPSMGMEIKKLSL